METPKYALVLTGELLSGFNADSAWPKLARKPVTTTSSSTELRMRSTAGPDNTACVAAA